jgi:hypothetical protein
MSATNASITEARKMARLFMGRSGLTVLFDRPMRRNFLHEIDVISHFPLCPEDFTSLNLH